jgi:dTDP-4-amino-4,6-dideoxygalactose transaminase
MIPVTKPFLPPFEEYSDIIQGVFKREWLTNNGPLLQELESKLQHQLKLNHLLCVGNGTIALQLAIKALKFSGKVITTPFSYVATSSSLVWEGCEPKYVDVEQNGFNIDPSRIEAAITPDVTGILATHCFGFPCDVEAIQSIAHRHQIRVIYDGAHAFGTTVNGRSVFEYGDISTCSFHATKLFHTVEGGMVVANSPKLIDRLSKMRNFGHDGPEKFDGVGINGKNSELHAAMGLVNLRCIGRILDRRRTHCQLYNELLKTTGAILPDILNENWNFAYYPVLFADEAECLAVKEGLEKSQVLARRYFYPSLNTINAWGEGRCKNAENIASRILCLPLFYELSDSEIEMIVRVIKSYMRKN